MSYTHQPPFTFLVSLPLKRWGNRFRRESGLEVAPHTWREARMWTWCVWLLVWSFLHYTVSGRDSGCPDASVFTYQKEEVPRPLGTLRKAEGGVLPESKLERKPSWRFIWIVSHLCCNWWKEMSFKRPSSNTVKWLQDSLEMVTHAAEVKLGWTVTGYVWDKQRETG